MFWEPFLCLRIDCSIFGNIGPVIFLSSLLINLFLFISFLMHSITPWYCRKFVLIDVNWINAWKLRRLPSLSIRSSMKQTPLSNHDLFKRIVGNPNFSDQFKKIVKRYIRVGYNLDIMRQSACLVLNPITVYSYGFLFNCTTVGQASDSMMALT